MEGFDLWLWLWLWFCLRLRLCDCTCTCSIPILLVRAVISGTAGPYANGRTLNEIRNDNVGDFPIAAFGDGK